MTLVANPYIFLMLMAYSGAFFTGKHLQLVFSIGLLIFATILIPHIQLSDNLIYEQYYYDAKNMNRDGAQLSVVYLMINKFFSSFIPYEIFRALLIAFILGTKLYLFRLFCGQSFAPILFYLALQFYVDSYILRASLAASFILFALIARYNHRPILGGVLMLLAILVHPSALAIVPLFILLQLKLDRYVHLGVVAILLFLAFNPQAENVILTLALLLPDQNFIMLAKSYIGSTHGEAKGVLRGSVIIYTLIYVFNVLYFTQESKKLPDNVNFVVNCMVCSLLFLYAFNDMVVIADRLARFTLVFFSIGFFYCFHAFKNSTATILLFIAFTVLLFGGVLLDQGPFDLV